MENLNNLTSASGSPAMKVELITKIQEQVLKWAPAMKVLEEVIDDLLAYSLDVHQDVKKTIVGFIEEVCKQKIRMLPKVIKVLTLLLREESAMVIKRVIQACGTIYKNTLQFICSTDDVPEDMQDCWNQLCHIKAQILELIDHENDGIRTNAIKFLEGVIILQSFPDTDSLKRDNDFSLSNVPKNSELADQPKLEEEGKNIFEILLKFHSASHISSVNLIACTGTLCLIAKLRPSFMTQVVEALINLNTNLPPTLTNSQVSSVRKNLKMQFINLLKLPASFEWRSTIIPTLTDLGATQSEINRALPKMDKKEIQMRTKRAHDNELSRETAKKARIELDEKKKILQKLTASKDMEVDSDELKNQQQRANKANELFIAEALKSVELTSYLVTTTMQRLPEKCPDVFLASYRPSGVQSIPQQIEKIAKALAPQLTELRLGPGSAELSASPPMRLKGDDSTVSDKMDDGKVIIQDETARKLRETLERMKGEPKLKPRVKTLKLQEITKPLLKEMKQQFLLDAVKRILKCERQAVISGMGAKRRKIISVFASTFMPSVRAIILDYLMDDIVKRIDLVFMWIFEEYSLLQGFSRYSYVKSEQKHDYAYNLLFTELVMGILNRGAEFRERESLIKRLYLEAPLITDESLKVLIGMAETEDLEDCSLVLVKDLLIRRPPKEEVLIATLLKFAIHGRGSVREKAIENILNVYLLHQILIEDIEKFAVKWVSFLEKPSPPDDMLKMISPENRDDIADFSAWNEESVKLCLNLFLHLLQHNGSMIHSLCDVYVPASSDVKRIILRSIETPVKSLGIESQDLLRVIDNCVKGTETLVARIIHILTENSEWFRDTSKVSVLIPEIFISRYPNIRAGRESQDGVPNEAQRRTHSHPNRQLLKQERSHHGAAQVHEAQPAVDEGRVHPAARSQSRLKVAGGTVDHTDRAPRRSSRNRHIASRAEADRQGHVALSSRKGGLHSRGSWGCHAAVS